MKASIRLDKSSVRQFFLRHVEKLLFAGVLVVSAWIVWQAFGVEGFGKTPEDLLATIERTESHLKRTPAEATRLVPPPDYVALASRSRTLIGGDCYVHRVKWKRDLFPPLRLRPKPPIFLVAALRGEAGRGQFDIRDDAQPVQPGRHPVSGSIPAALHPNLGKRWAVITGLVPLKKQKQAYEEAFEYTLGRDPARDVVHYLGFFIQRAEVSRNPQSPDGLVWEDLPRSTLLIPSACDAWNNTAPEVVTPTFVHQRLTFPLGPLQGECWGEEVAHAPEIPLFVENESKSERDAERTGDRVVEDPFFQFDLSVRNKPARPEMAKRPYLEREPEYLLLRCFDFHVEPGKRYRYRVRLVLKNPNYGLPARFLMSKDLATAGWNVGEQWSEPTDTIAIPRDTMLLAVGVNAPRRLQDDPTAKMLLVKWVEQYGIVAHQETSPPLSRGKVMNFPGCKFLVPWVPGNNGEGNVDNTAEADNAVDVDYLTETLVLDMCGSDRLPGSRLVRPATILLLDPNGGLVVREELEDIPEYQRFTKPPERGEPETAGNLLGGGPEGMLWDFD